MTVKTSGSSITLSSSVMQKLWDNNETLIFLIELEMYGQLGSSDLSDDENEYLEKLRTNYFRKRFIVSRSLLKIIIQHILKKESSSEIILYRNDTGRVCVQDHEDIFISISYTEKLIALSISKLKHGIDIEYIRTVNLETFLRSFQKTETKKDVLEEDNVETLKKWTLKEAYCKLTDKSMLKSLNKEVDLEGIEHHEISIDSQYVLSVAFASINNSIDIYCIQKETPIKIQAPSLKYI